MLLVGCLFYEGLPNIQLTILSSSHDQVSGDDVLIGLEGDAARIVMETDNLEFWLNNTKVSPVLRTGLKGPEYLVTGLNEGENHLELHHRIYGLLSNLILTAHPVTGPIFSGPKQYPFVCTVVSELGKQPLVDTTGNTGFPVMDDSGNQIGLSKDCSIKPYVQFIYQTNAGRWSPLPADGSRPEDLAKTELSDGRIVDFIVRQERGTINRFIYSFATLASLGDKADDASSKNWNRRLLFHFQGGVGIGHTQGRMRPYPHNKQALQKGYAVISSSGTSTRTHQNLQLGGETALMVKEHFIKRFGVPEYTVAMGSSGGALQQYLYAQNHSNLLDAGVPRYSYPDMVSQTTHIADCELLEYYMDATDRNNTKWNSASNRQGLVGLNAMDNLTDPLAEMKTMLGYGSALGMTECVAGWRGLTPLIMNPSFGTVLNQEKMQPANVMADVQWSIYDDMKNIYGVDKNGDALVSFDNVGVQYGLTALRDGKLSKTEFIKLNALIGGWKHPSKMVKEGFPFTGSSADVQADPTTFDPWSSRNINLSPDGVQPAPRTKGDLQAIRRAYETGMVFDGELNMPVIEWRHYLEDELDMHNSHQSFSIRQRIINKMGHAGNQVIWFKEKPVRTRRGLRILRSENKFEPNSAALELIHQWLMNIRANPQQSIAANKPAAAVDGCYQADGSLIASGDGVWNGILDNKPNGACTQKFKTYTTSRIEAGGPIEGNIFKCRLKQVTSALKDGTYGQLAFSTHEVEQLKNIFPDGVCDYSQPDWGRPADL